MVKNKPNNQYPEYFHWKNMRARCAAPSIHKNREHYKTISVCKEWDSFKQFYIDMGPKPHEKASLDRIDNEGDYTPSNCRWADDTTQARNTSKVTTFTYKGVVGCIPELAEHFKLNSNSIHKRMQKGQTIEEAIDGLLATKITYDGLTMTKKEWAIHLGVKPTTMYARFNNNTDLSKILKA